MILPFFVLLLCRAMVFSTILFLFYFLPCFLLGYVLLPKKYRNYWVLIASLAFYAWGAPLFIFVVLFSTLIDFQVVKKMHLCINSADKKKWLVLSICLNVGLLAYFKYANFFIDNVNDVLSYFHWNTISWVSVMLPIGISFFVFQSITYAVDVYGGVNPPVRKFSQYLLYILSFPQMIAGPIVKYNDIASELAERNETVDDRLLGFYRFCIGLGKKILIANVLAVQADLILDGDIIEASSGKIWVGLIAYTFQIYFDFSGYSDMAIGLGRMMGFTFPENFNSPYLAKSISEFWRRWHMTLNEFMLSYLYIPLGGNRVSKTRLYFNLSLVFVLSGLWHGASWNFILWGAYHGSFLIFDRLFLKNLLERVGALVATVFTFFIVVVGWAIFRMEDFSRMQLVIDKLFSFQNGTGFEMDYQFCVVLVVAIFFSVLTVTRWGRDLEVFCFEKDVLNLSGHLKFGLIAFILFMLSVAGIAGTDFNPFIYLRF